MDELAENEVRVGKDSNSGATSGYIYQALQNNDEVYVYAIGPIATYNAVMAIIKASGLAQQGRIRFSVEPYLKDVPTKSDSGEMMVTTTVGFALTVIP